MAYGGGDHRDQVWLPTLLLGGEFFNEVINRSVKNF